MSNSQPIVALSLPTNSSDRAIGIADAIRRLCERVGATVVELPRMRDPKAYAAEVAETLARAIVLIVDFTGDELAHVPPADAVVEATLMRHVHRKPVWLLSASPADPRPIDLAQTELYPMGSGRRAAGALIEELHEPLATLVAASTAGTAQTDAAPQPPPAPAAKAEVEPAPPAPPPQAETAQYKPTRTSDTEMRVNPRAKPKEKPAELTISAGNVVDEPRNPLISSEHDLGQAAAAARAAAEEALGEPQLLATIAAHDSPIRAVAVETTLGYGASCDRTGTVALWPLAVRGTGVEPQVRRSVASEAEPIRCVAFDRRGKRLVIGDKAGHLRAWRLATFADASTAELPEPCDAVEAHPGGVRVVAALPIQTVELRTLSGGEDGSIVKWNVTQRKPMGRWRAHHGGIRAISLTEDRTQALTAGEDGTLTLWDIGNAQDLRMITRAHKGRIYDVAVSAKGERAISAGHDGAKLWDLAGGGEELNLLLAHKGAVRATDLLPGRSLAITAGDDGSIALWCLRRRLLLCHYDAHEGHAVTAARAIDGTHFVTATDAGKIHLWHVPDNNA